MAIVHSRFARVFFGTTNGTNSGGLGGDLGANSDHEVIALQLDKRINHRFNVWKGVLESECRTLLTEYQQIHKQSSSPSPSKDYDDAE